MNGVRVNGANRNDVRGNGVPVNGGRVNDVPVNGGRVDDVRGTPSPPGGLRSAVRSADGPPPLLVIAHGSRDARHAATVRELSAAAAAARPGLRVEAAFLDLCGPAVPEAVARLAADGVREAVALPLLLTRAFHARTDVPAALRRAAAEQPGVRLRPAGVLGPSPLLVAALERRLAEAGLREADRATTSVVLAAAGSSDPAANAVVERVARDWRRTAGWAEVLAAHASASGPRTEDAVRALRARGARRIAVAPYVVAPGFLPDRIAAGARAAGADLLAPVLGAAPELAALLLRRYAEALAAAPVGAG